MVSADRGSVRLVWLCGNVGLVCFDCKCTVPLLSGATRHQTIDRQQLNMVLEQFVKRQTEAGIALSRDWLSEVALRVRDAWPIASSDPFTSEQTNCAALTMFRLWLCAQDNGSEDDATTTGSTGIAAAPIAQAVPRRGNWTAWGGKRPPASARPKTADRMRIMAKAVLGDIKLRRVWQEHARAKVELLKSLFDRGLITWQMAEAQQRKVLLELEATGVGRPVAFGYAYRI
jgi:hypothetical protein